MASTLRICRPAGASNSILPRAAAGCRHISHSTSASVRARCSLNLRNQQPVAPNQSSRGSVASFHTTPSVHASRAQQPGGNPAATSLGLLDVLGNIPAPSTSVDICMSSGFVLNSGARVTDGSGIILIGGEAFRWRPWELSPSASEGKPRLQNKKGQYDVPPPSLSLFAHLWPRPDLLILGVGPENRPLSPELRKAVSALGIRVEVLDTRNAAAQFNLLATERGVDDVAAALIPIGWVEGQGAPSDDEGEITHE
ncbi:hypothetical protein PFICI_05803 [Pestalotiopsis fici W106-1]|uniref:NADH dehydrogenase [ubiquinone] 1 alpha subcomplex assembly factor 3 n=1 Tax=Pestalotiopsis fici (strain W106-1 / CGMCC3.15140) TaxID=1229662 RepID=W3XET9_PESFW|nr:uncharacterized protein PFICI_05803 [Pestalotiopsis fici W106-1]ETS83927.1 hypothetical protein PFICI_05803 [Pestalotiopsis fici W106-1]